LVEVLVCFKSRVLAGLTRNSVFNDPAVWKRILCNLEFVSRNKSEGNPRVKQLLVYVLIRQGNLYLTYRRTQKAGEKRLRSKLAVGFGGHVNADEFSKKPPRTEDDLSFVLLAAWREMSEELGLCRGDADEPRLIGFLNDDSIKVNRDHFGIVWEITPHKKDITPKEDALTDLEFHTLDELAKKRGLESWSRLIVSYLCEQHQ